MKRLESVKEKTDVSEVLQKSPVDHKILAQLAMVTHMNASKVNDPQVALLTLKLRTHTCS